MHTPCSEYMIQTFSKINSVKCYSTPKTLPLIVFEFLNTIIFPYGRNKFIIASILEYVSVLRNMRLIFDDEVLEGSEMTKSLTVFLLKK